MTICDLFENNSVSLNESLQRANQYRSLPCTVSWPFHEIHFFLSQWIGVWISVSFCHDQDSVLMRSSSQCVNQHTFHILVFNILEFVEVYLQQHMCRSWCMLRESNKFMTEIDSSLIQWTSICISKSFSHDRDLLLNCSEGHCLNQQIFWLWSRFVLLVQCFWIDFGMNRWTDSFPCIIVSKSFNWNDSRGIFHQ